MTDTTAPTLCPECGAVVPPGGRGMGKLYCSRQHKRQHYERSRTRGAILLPFQMAHAYGRHAKAGTPEAEAAKLGRREIARITRIFLREDQDAGRPNLAAHVLALAERGESYQDRTRKAQAGWVPDE